MTEVVSQSSERFTSNSPDHMLNMAKADVNQSSDLTITRTILDTFVKMVVCRKVTVQKVAHWDGRVLESCITLEEDSPVILDVSHHETNSLSSDSSGQRTSDSTPDEDATKLCSPLTSSLPACRNDISQTTAQLQAVCLKHMDTSETSKRHGSALAPAAAGANEDQCLLHVNFAHLDDSSEQHQGAETVKLDDSGVDKLNEVYARTSNAHITRTLEDWKRGLHGAPDAGNIKTVRDESNPASQAQTEARNDLTIGRCERMAVDEQLETVLHLTNEENVGTSSAGETQLELKVCRKSSIAKVPDTHTEFVSQDDCSDHHGCTGSAVRSSNRHACREKGLTVSDWVVQLDRDISETSGMVRDVEMYKEGKHQESKKASETDSNHTCAKTDSSLQMKISDGKHRTKSYLKATKHGFSGSDSIPVLDHSQLLKYSYPDNVSDESTAASVPSKNDFRAKPHQASNRMDPFAHLFECSFPPLNQTHENAASSSSSPSKRSQITSKSLSANFLLTSGNTTVKSPTPVSKKSAVKVEPDDDCMITAAYNVKSHQTSSSCHSQPSGGRRVAASIGSSPSRQVSATSAPVRQVQQVLEEQHHGMQTDVQAMHSSVPRRHSLPGRPAGYRVSSRVGPVPPASSTQIHPSTRPFEFKCQICGKVFKRRSHLVVHMNFHMGVRHYRCQECQQSYVQRGDLLRHFRSKAHRHTMSKCAG